MQPPDRTHTVHQRVMNLEVDREAFRAVGRRFRSFFLCEADALDIDVDALDAIASVAFDLVLYCLLHVPANVRDAQSVFDGDVGVNHDLRRIAV